MGAADTVRRLLRSVGWGLAWAAALAALALFSGAAEEFIYVAF